jgi:PAS domain S-box-containing protein
MRQPEGDLFDGVFDALGAGLIVLDSSLHVVGWNAWMASAAGITAEAAAGKQLEELFPGATFHRLNSAMTEALHSGASSLLTHSLHPALFPLKTRAGRNLIHDISVHPVGPKPFSRCLVQIVDVTVTAEREHVLRKRQNARYAAVVDNAPDAILTLDADGLIQFSNPAAARQLGYSSQELLQQPISSLFENQAAWAEAWRSLLHGDVLGRVLELVARRKDGSPSYLEVSASRWFDGSRVFVSAILRDINERHAAEAALRRLNETLEERVATTLAERKLLADIVETTDAFIQVLDLDFNLMAVNKASAGEFERLFGHRPRVGDNILDLLAAHPQEQANAKALWSRALAGEEFTVVQDFGDPARDRRFYELKFDALRDADGKQIAAFQFVYDVTERLEHQAQLTRTEEALRQSQKMEAIGQLTGGIAHDFNNLLTGIMGAMDILKRRLAANRYDDVERFMDAAITSANRAAALTHRLLAFARRQPLAPKPIDANQLIGGMEDFLRRTLGEQVQLEVKVDPDLWPILTDPHQLENAIVNLAINGRDAMPDGGRLTISSRNIQIAEALVLGHEVIDAGDYVVICVGDTGTGMTPEIVSKVFEPFFTTKPIGQGTGLGLSMIYGFTKQTRGHVRIESTVGIGTDVSLYLPRYTGSLSLDELDGGSDVPSGEGETVLLVEDDSSVRLLIGEVLRELGYACVEAIDAKAALPILMSNARIDLMITDVGLPSTNGRQLAELARRRRPDLKVLFVTGYAEHATGTERFLEPGMEMVTKPFALDALAQKIRSMLVPGSQL